MRNRRTNENESLVTGLLSAAIASGITYFLYGTDKGKDTRKKMGTVALKMRDKTIELKDEALESGNMLYGAAKDSYENLTKLFVEHAATLKNLEKDDVLWLTDRFKERMSDVWEETREDIEDVLEDAKA